MADEFFFLLLILAPSLLFFQDPSFVGGETLLARICLRESLDDRIKVETRNEKGCIFGSLWNVGEGK
jgi:hypothetical protein